MTRLAMLERKRCRVCQKNLAARKGSTVLGLPTYGGRCDTCRKGRSSRGTLRQQALGAQCEGCGFVPEHPEQLQVDHILPTAAGGTGHRSNLQTLCANCHVLKTVQDRGRRFRVERTA